MQRLLTGLLVITALTAAGCSNDTSDPATAAAEAGSSDTTTGIRLVSALDGAAILADPPDGLIVLDVRTPEEFAEGHLEGAIMLDFYGDDFAEQLAGLDPDVSYLLYCRSGNRSGQTRAFMSDLGFSDVADIDGGILSWTGAGLLTVQP